MKRLYRLFLALCSLQSSPLIGVSNSLVAIDKIIVFYLDMTKKMYYHKFFEDFSKTNVLEQFINKNKQKKIESSLYFNNSSFIKVMTEEDNNHYIRQILIDENYNVLFFLHNQASYAGHLAKKNNLLLPKVLFDTIFLAVSIYSEDDTDISGFEIITNFDEHNRAFTGAQYVPWIQSQITDYTQKTSILSNAIFLPTDDIKELIFSDKIMQNDLLIDEIFEEMQKKDAK